MEEKSASIQILETLKKLMSLLRQVIETEFKQLNLTAPQGILLSILAKEGEMNVSDLSQKMGLTSSTVSGIIDRLEKGGFLQRKRSGEDRRVVFVSVNREKCDALAIEQKIEIKLEEVMNQYSQQELEGILQGLVKLQTILLNSNIRK